MDDRRVEKVRFIVEKLQADQLAVDLQWSLFTAASLSYRFDSALRPFPPMHLKDENNKDMKSLEGTIDNIPSLSQLSESLAELPDSAVDLLHWVLDSKPFSLTSLRKEQFSEIQKKTAHVTEVPEPNFIFEVVPSEVNEVKFEQLRSGRDVLFAYHGSRIENFHSILHNGLASHLNKTSMFGEGTYLSSELAVSMPYSPTGLAWEHSQMGHKLGCVAVCAMIDDPSVKCQERTGSENGNTKKSRSRVQGSMAGEVPEKYYIVRNNEMIQVRYLLVYSEKTKPKKTGVSGEQMRWIQENKFLLMMMFYVILLVAIGIANSKSFQFYLRKIFR